MVLFFCFFYLKGGVMGEMHDEQELKATLDITAEFYDPRQVDSKTRFLIPRRLEISP